MKKRMVAILLSAVFTVTMCVGCGAKEIETLPQVQEEVIEEADAEMQEDEMENEEVESEVPTEEETQQEAVEEEDSMENLSNEEWVLDLRVKINKPTFIVINNTTRERKVLEDGAEYTLTEGDEFGLATPPIWREVSETAELYDTVDLKYNCLVYNLNYDMITENTEFTVTYNNLEGEPVSTTIYLSK